MSVRYKLLVTLCLLVIVALFLGLPFLPLWALNAVFHLGIPYTFSSWFGTVVLVFLLLLFIRWCQKGSAA